jgi:hypothetical protein
MKKALSAFWRKVTFRRDRRASSETSTLVECVPSTLLATVDHEPCEQEEKQWTGEILRALRRLEGPDECEAKQRTVRLSVVVLSLSLIMATDCRLFPPTHPMTYVENDLRLSSGFSSPRMRSLPSNGSSTCELYIHSRLRGLTATQPKRYIGSSRRSPSSLPLRFFSRSARACRSKSRRPRTISQTGSQLSPPTSSRARPSTTRICG